MYLRTGQRHLLHLWFCYAQSFFVSSADKINALFFPNVWFTADEPSKDQAFLSAKRRRCESAIIADVREKDATASQKPVMVACYLVPDSDTETAETGAAESMTTLRG